MTEVLRPGTAAAAATAVDRACETLAAGGVVILPTDTVYGLTVAAFKLEGPFSSGEKIRLTPWRDPIRSLYAVKGRAAATPSLILAASWEDATLLAAEPLDVVESFVTQTPRPVTVIIAARTNWGPPFTNRAGGVALRVPGAGFIKGVLRENKYAFSVSANRPGGPEPYAFDMVPAGVLAGADLAVDGGGTPFKTASWLVDFTAPTPKVVRGGGEAEQALFDFTR